MKLTKRWEPAHTEYFVRVIRPNGEVLDWYDGCCYRSTASAQKYVDRYNSRPRRYGQAEVGSIHRPRSQVWSGALPLGGISEERKV